MRNKIIIIFSIFLFNSCDSSGNVRIINLYPFNVIATIEAEYNGVLHENSIQLSFKENFAPAAMGHIEYNYITKISIKTKEGTFLAEYSPEYIFKVRNAYSSRKKNQIEYWILSERGLVFMSE
jgi:hypothetical protein